MPGHKKPVNEAPSTEPQSAPPPSTQLGGKAGRGNFHIKCTVRSSGVFAGWLDYSGSGNHVWLSGDDPNTPTGMQFNWYYSGGKQYLNPKGTYVGDPRYLGNNQHNPDWIGQAEWNYWAWCVPIYWQEPDGNICNADNHSFFLINQGGGYVNWSNDTTTALKCELV